MLTAAVVLATAGAGVPVAASAATRTPPTVKLQAANFRFCSASSSTCLPERDDNHTTTVKVGTRVEWLYEDHACDAVAVCPGHNVVFPTRYGSPNLVKKDGAVLLRATFTRPGRYSYFCSAHQSFGMTGTIVVTRR